MKKLSECYSRCLIDSHISECRKEYLRKLSPAEYVRHVKEAGFESAMVYACCHNGNCYYPTKVGHQHGNLAGRDVFGEIVQGLHREGILPIAYYTATYHNDCARRFPQACVVSSSGKPETGRYHFTCPNQPEAVEFYRAQIREIAAYDIGGLFIDMSFWPCVCLCDACRRKFGRPLPERIDWNDPEWIAFQRFREQSMAEFAELLTTTAREKKPELPVVHQFSPVLHGWCLGQSAAIVEKASDYASGDFYGNKLQQRFAVKAFDAMTNRPPFEFMTSRCVNLRDHTSTKDPAELLASALTTLANGGAYFFIDAIHPDGTLCDDVYQLFGRLNAVLTPYREAVAKRHFRLDAEIGLYFSIECCVDRSLDGIRLRGYSGLQANNMAVRKNAFLDEALGTAEILTRMHLPYRVVPHATRLEGLRALILTNASYLTEEECASLRDFVRKGGTLFATGTSSLQRLDGTSSGNFQLSDLLGVDFEKTSPFSLCYVGEKQVLADGRAALVRPHPDAEVLSHLAFPDFPVQDPVHYASIHSDPPGAQSDYPALTTHRYGEGLCVYLAAPVFLLRQYTQREFGKRLFAKFLPTPLVAEKNLPPSAELTLLRGEKGGEHLLCLVNAQDEYPAIPLHDVSLSLRLPYAVQGVRRISDDAPADFTQEGGVFTLRIPKIDVGDFFLLR